MLIAASPLRRFAASPLRRFAGWRGMREPVGDRDALGERGGRNSRWLCSGSIVAGSGTHANQAIQSGCVIFSSTNRQARKNCRSARMNDRLNFRIGIATHLEKPIKIIEQSAISNDASRH
nr:hypothetical protein [Burkholderia ambifaria]